MAFQLHLTNAIKNAPFGRSTRNTLLAFVGKNNALGVTLEFGSVFQQNLKSTLKFLGIVFPAISLFIVVDSIKEDDFSNLVLIIYMAIALTVVVPSTFIYTRLKLSYLNKYVCSTLFAVSTLLLVIAYYLIASLIDGSNIDIAFLKRMSVLMFCIFVGLYLQLPWKRDGV